MSFERDFYKDIQDKKRSGRGIFSRKATIKGGKNSPLKTPYYFMDKKERDALNSKEISYKLKEVMSFEEFDKLPKDIKIKVLESWIKIFSLDYISIKMNLSNEQVKELYTSLNVSYAKKRGIRSTVMLNGDESLSVEDAYRKVMNNDNMSIDEFIKYNIPTQIYIDAFVRLKKHIDKSAVVESYLQIPRILYISNLKNKSTYNEHKNYALSYWRNINNLSENSDEVTSEADSNIVVDDNAKTAPEESPKTQESSFENSLSDSKKHNNDSKTNIIANIDISTSEYNVRIKGIQNKDTLSRKLKTVRQEVKDMNPNKAYRVTILIEEVE